MELLLALEVESIGEQALRGLKRLLEDERLPPDLVSVAAIGVACTEAIAELLGSDSALLLGRYRAQQSALRAVLRRRRRLMRLTKKGVT